MASFLQEVKKGCRKVFASSGGNAGLAAAYACKKLNVPMTLFVPETTPEFMKERIRGEVSPFAHFYLHQANKKGQSVRTPDLS